jgi:hydroxyethylthiazole kinase-like uncharacterized protein yjeF
MVKNSKIITSQQAKAIDIKARDKLGISTLVLMENAGRAVAEEVLKSIGSKKAVAIFCGKGNNGADGFVAARHLLTRRIKADLYLAGEISDVQNEAKTNLEMLLKLKLKIMEVNENNLHLVKNNIYRYSLIVDALLGVGLKGEVKGIFRDLIETINTSKAYILSVDIPSGLDATTGEVLGSCVKADKTVTFVAKKQGMILGNGPKYCGKVIVRDLGIPL